MFVHLRAFTSLLLRLRPCVCKVAVVSWMLLLTGPAVAADDPVDIFDLPLDELVEVKVVSVAGVEQGWFATPAAVHVITREEIRRSGHLHLAELFRMVPGFYVGRASSSEWTTGVRGLSDQFYPYLQASVDGRSIYNELFSGVYWDVQTPLLEDIEQVEVVRGPGATLWGANAVNGVINVTSREAHDTLGTYVSAGGGSEERAFGMVRHGMEVKPGLSLRGWGRYVMRDSTGSASTGGQRNDEWSVFRGGARMDWAIDDVYALMVQAEGYDTPKLEQSRLLPGGLVLGEGNARGGHGIMRLKRDTGSAETRDLSGLTFQAYYDFENRDNVIAFGQKRHTVDVDLRHHFMYGMRNDVIWGAGYRYRRTNTESVPALSLIPPEISSNLATFFVQDTFHLIPDELFVMLGAKLEYNSFTGFEIQPSGRLWWTPNENHTLWAAISRPVRVPSLINQFLDIVFPRPGATPPFINLLGSDDLRSEKLLAYEAGYRLRPIDDLVLDVAGFFFDYDDLFALETTMLVPLTAAFTNNNRAKTWGVEVAARWKPCERWQLHASYSYLGVSSPDVGANPGGGLNNRDPNHQFQLRSYLDVTEDLELNAGLYFVDRVERRTVIPSYVRLDLGLTWRPIENVELTLWGQNLTESRHRESELTQFDENVAEIQRGVYGRVSISF